MYQLNKEIGWLLLCSLTDLKNKPLKFKIMNTNLVVFKNLENQIAVLEDKCIHRHVSLSPGRVVKGCLECPYHGALFDINGKCQKVLSDLNGDKLPQKKVKKYEHFIDEYNYIWVNLSADRPSVKTPSLFNLNPRAKILKFQYAIKAPALAIIENFVDCAHTGVVHKGFFRGEASSLVTVQVESNEKRVRIESRGEKQSDSILSRIFNPKQKSIIHFDEYVAPLSVKVTYEIGSIKIITVSVCTPISENHTNVHTFISLEAPFGLKNILSLFLNYYTKIILAQDVEILEDQGQNLINLQNTNSSFFKSDRAIIEVIRLYKHYVNDDSKTFNGKQFEFEMRI